MTPQCDLLTLAAPPLTMNTTLPSSLHVTIEPQRSYWVRDVVLDWRVTRSCQSCLVGVKASVSLPLLQSWVGVTLVMCGVLAASCLNTTKGSQCTRLYVFFY